MNTIKLFARVPGLQKLLAVVACTILIMSPVSAQQGLDEMPLMVQAIDIENNSVTLVGLGVPAAEYRMAFDIRIKLINGETAGPAGLQVNDSVTALLDTSGRVAHALFVVAKP